MMCRVNKMPNILCHVVRTAHISGDIVRFIRDLKEKKFD